MQNCKWTKELVTLGIAVVALASSLAPSKAQAQENFAWITNTNGVTWKKKISGTGKLWFDYVYLGTIDGISRWKISPEIVKVAEIVVPEHAKINEIDVARCVNLTNIILLPATTTSFDVYHRPTVHGEKMSIVITNSGLRTITCKKTMRDLIRLYEGGAGFHEGGWSKEWSVQ